MIASDYNTTHSPYYTGYTVNAETISEELPVAIEDARAQLRMDDPTPEDDAASANSLEIAPSLRDACEAAKQRHFAQRRAETATATDSKLSKRRARCLA